MDAIILPLAVPGTSLNDAFDQLKTTSRSGIVVEEPTGYRLYSAAAIVRGLHDRIATIADLSAIEGDGDTVQLVDLPALAPPAGEVLTIDLLTQSILGRSQYGLLAAGLAAGLNGALIITDREQLRHYLEPFPRGCYCSVLGCKESVQPNERCRIHNQPGVCWPRR